MPKGRKPRPLKLVENDKDRFTKKELDERENGEPQGCPDALKPPKSLSAAAKKEWRRVVALYRSLDARIINDLDVATLTTYCESVAIYQKAQMEYRERPLIYMSADGNPVENPYLAIMRKEGLNIAKYAEQLCLSPVGRARMGVAAAKKAVEDDPMAKYLNKYSD